MKRDADMVVLDHPLDGFGDRFQQRRIVEMRDEEVVDLEQETQLITFFPKLALIVLRLRRS